VVFVGYLANGDVVEAGSVVVEDNKVTLSSYWSQSVLLALCDEPVFVCQVLELHRIVEEHHRLAAELSKSSGEGKKHQPAFDEAAKVG
jgi:hypothetical protein